MLMRMLSELIVYACPNGPLAEQITRYFALARARHAPNLAHAYPPHISLTGFFHDDSGRVPAYVATLGAALDSMGPAPCVQVTGLATGDDWHGLVIDAPGLEELTRRFAARAVSPSRIDPIRVKTRLHLSLAYGHAAAHAEGLAALAREQVDATAPCGWELRLYSRTRQPAPSWLCHAAWMLQRAPVPGHAPAKIP